MKLLLRINQVGATILLATHDSTMVNTVRNRVVELQNGRLVRDEYRGYTRFVDPKIHMSGEDANFSQIRLKN